MITLEKVFQTGDDVWVLRANGVDLYEWYIRDRTNEIYDGYTIRHRNPVRSYPKLTGTNIDHWKLGSTLSVAYIVYILRKLSIVTNLVEFYETLAKYGWKEQVNREIENINKRGL